ncbi:MAG TPA: TlyA family RNA methyltransferase [Actinomycetes bacterium]|nr:TlyA family RNA methyltransferase [Actinomycetes bacterium]
MPTRVRLDRELVRRGLSPSREAAAEAVQDGLVLVSGTLATKPSRQVSPAEPIELKHPSRRWASRGGDKLAPALERLGLEVAGRRCLDAGASTGGFTHVLLERGAAEVVAADVGRGQLDARLRQDPRVRVHDAVNVRTLTPELIGGPVDLTVADLSFISLRLVLPALTAATARGGDLVLLVKPQFEAGREAVRKGGVVRDPDAWAAAVRAVAEAAAGQGLGVAGICPSPLPGPAGNVEFFLHLRAGAAPLDEAALGGALAEAAALPRRRGPGNPGGAPR